MRIAATRPGALLRTPFHSVRTVRGAMAPPPAALNDAAADAVPGAPGDAAAVAALLQRRALGLVSSFMTDDGAKVDYVACAKSAEFADYVAATALLRGVEAEALGTVPQRRAFFLNLYNCLTVHGLLDAASTAGSLPSSVQKLPDFWNRTSYRVGRRELNLNDIEHGILRGNALQPAARAPHWRADDERAALALPLDPRIHFALNCGAKSCPPIRVFTADNLEYGLTAAAASFLEGETKVEGRVVTLSRLLLWYGRDFGSTQREVLQTVARLLREGSATRAALEGLLADTRDAPVGFAASAFNAAQKMALPNFCPRGAVDVRFSPYDWSLNTT